MPARFKLACVLFDLDGTLVDTSQDLITALNVTLTTHGFEKVSECAVKPYISFGVEAMLKQSIAAPIDARLTSKLSAALLDYYGNNLAICSALYSGMHETLAYIESHNLKWGVVTNKRKRFTQPLMSVLNLADRAVCVISGDTTPFGKPHPEPMLMACRVANVAAEQCVYIGDAHHDIMAGQAVRMKTLAATYGFLKPDDQPELWGADALVSSPAQINTWINAALCH